MKVHKDPTAWDLDFFRGGGGRDNRGTSTAGGTLPTTQLWLQPPLVRPRSTERPFSHQLPLVTQISAMKSG